MKKNMKRAIAAVLLAATTASLATAASWRDTITVDVNKVTVISNHKTMTGETFLWNDKTYIPLRETLEAAGCKVEWNQATATATISNRYAAIANVLNQCYQFGGVIHNTYATIDALQNVITLYQDPGYTATDKANFAKPILSEAKLAAMYTSDYITFGIATQALYLNANDWGTLLPELQEIYATLNTAVQDYKTFVTGMQDIATVTSTQRQKLIDDGYALQTKLNTLYNRMSSYVEVLNKQLVYSPVIN